MASSSAHAAATEGKADGSDGSVPMRSSAPPSKVGADHYERSCEDLRADIREDVSGKGMNELEILLRDEKKRQDAQQRSWQRAKGEGPWSELGRFLKSGYDVNANADASDTTDEDEEERGEMNDVIDIGGDTGGESGDGGGECKDDNLRCVV